MDKFFKSSILQNLFDSRSEEFENYIYRTDDSGDKIYDEITNELDKIE